jgi:predicted permease
MWIAGKKDRVGVLVQAIFRSGYSLIGIPLAGQLYGEEGAVAATILSAALIPCFNVLAVISLSALGENDGKRISVRKILLDIVKNPLILGIAAALVCIGIRSMFNHFDITFRLSDIGPLFAVLQYLADLAIPLALLVLGAQFEFSAVPELKKEIIVATFMRVLLAPLAGLGVALLLFPDFTGAHYAALTALFATPVAVSSVPMAQEMGADTQLAGQLVVWTTVLSGFTIFLIALILKSIGVFT